MSLSYKLPGKFMFECLDIIWLYPVYNATLSCLGIVIISGIKDKNIHRFRVAIVGICSLLISVILLCTGHNLQGLIYFYEHITELLPIAILWKSDKIMISFMNQSSSSGPSSSGPSSSGPSSSALPLSEPSSSGPSYTRHVANQEELVPSKDLPDKQLDEMFGPPNKDHLKAAIDKIVGQSEECKQNNNGSYKWSIYSVDYSPSLRLSYQDKNAIARQLLGLRTKYDMRFNKTTNSTKVMIAKGISGKKTNVAVTCNKATIDDLNSGLNE